MLKRELFIGLLIALFSLGLTGVTFADDPGGYNNFNNTISIYGENDTRDEAEINQPTAMELEHGNLDGMKDSEPLACDDDHVQSVDVFASNDCADLFNDLYRS